MEEVNQQRSKELELIPNTRQRLPPDANSILPASRDVRESTPMPDGELGFGDIRSKTPENHADNGLGRSRLHRFFHRFSIN